MTDLQETGTLESEYRWLVQWCARLAKTPDTADDLAQETMLEALRQHHKLREPGARRAWLAVIARYVYLRARRKAWRDEARSVRLDPDAEIADGISIAEEVEHRELRDTLEQALARVPPPTRQMLLAHYLQQASYRTIAETTGVSEEAVAMRLSRARRALRRILMTEFVGELQAYCTDSMADAGWRTTKLWCSACGRHRLLARLPPQTETVAFRCPGCHPTRSAVSSAYPLNNQAFVRLLGSVRRPEVLMHRATTWAYTYFHEAIREGTAPCTHCQRSVALHTSSRDDTGHQQNRNGLYLICNACGTTVSASVQGYLQTLPEVQRFKARYDRIRTVPSEQIEAEGVEAQVTHFQSVTSAACLVVVAPHRAQDLHYPITVVADPRRV